MTQQSINPRTGEAFGPIFTDTTSAETDEKISNAVEAFREWSQTPSGFRGDVLFQLADALDAHKDELAELANQETGLGLPRLSGEVGRTTFQIRTFAHALKDPQFCAPEVDAAVDAPLPSGHPEFLRTFRGIGAVAVFGANNFPFAFSVLGGDTASALAAGCSVVIKSHPSHPQTSQRTFDIANVALSDAGAPAHLISLGHGLEFGKQIITDPRVSAGAFTGSRNGGRALFNLAQSRSHPIPFYGELGSINPVVVLESALQDRASFLSAYLDSLLLGGGQFCTNPSVLFLPAHSDNESEISKILLEREPQPFLSQGSKKIHDENRMILRSSVECTSIQGREVSGTGFYSSAEVLFVSASNVDTSVLFETECFGPTGVVITYDDISEVLSLLAKLDGALVGSLFASVDDDSVHSIVGALSRFCGRVAWNAWPTGVAVTAGQHHGGPYPASTSPLHTSVGIHAIDRFLRPVSFQGFPLQIINSF